MSQQHRQIDELSESYGESLRSPESGDPSLRDAAPALAEPYERG